MRINSAKEKQNIDYFRRILYEHVLEIHKKRYPYDTPVYNPWKFDENQQ